MPALWLAQLLCPARHAICALAYDAETTAPADVDAQLLRVVDGTQGVNPWCGLCGSRELHVEHGKLRTNDWEEATQQLRELEERQLATRLALGEASRN